MNVRRANEDDIPQMVDLAEERRRLYESYQPTFWRPSLNARSTQAAFFTAVIRNTSNAIASVYVNAGVYRGFITPI
jgi:hypothetical protein